MELHILPESISRIFYEENKHRSSDAGFDIFCPEDITINPGETKRVNMKVKCSFKKDGKLIHSFLMTRSSIDNTPLSLSNGVGLIDKTYTGDIIASFRHVFLNREPYTIKRGERLVQLVPMSYEEFVPKIVNKLDNTERGDNGFGSTGRF